MSDKYKNAPQAPAPKTQAGSGSLTNMPSHAEIERWNREEKPKIIAGIRESWRQIQTKARQLNGAVRLYDQSAN